VNRRIALPVLMLTVAVLVLAATGCSSDDPYSGTWSAPDDRGTFVIAKASDGWWSIDIGPGGKTIYGADIDGELQTANGRSSFKPDGDALLFRNLPDAEPLELTRQ
jgi:hypothetical protein